MAIEPNRLIDLVTVADMHAYLGIKDDNVSDDATIQLCITAASLYWLWYTGRDTIADTVVSPFVAPVAYNENYDGSGSNRMFLRNVPIQSVQSLTVNTRTIPQSTAFGQAGWLIDSSQKSLVIRGGGGASQSFTSDVLFIGFVGNFFAKGLQNVNVQYTAGFNGVPVDIQLAATQMIAVNYKRKDWIDQASRAMAGGAGTTSYRAWEMPQEVRSVMNNYKRYALAG